MEFFSEALDWVIGLIQTLMTIAAVALVVVLLYWFIRPFFKRAGETTNDGGDGDSDKPHNNEPIYYSTIYPWITIPVGVLLSALLGMIVTALLPDGMFDFVGGYFIQASIISLVFAMLLFRGGLWEVPIGHVAVPTFLGFRIPKYVLSEGYQWLPSPLVEIRNTDESSEDNPVDIRERTLPIAEATVLAIDTTGGKDSDDDTSKSEDGNSLVKDEYANLRLAAIKIKTTFQFIVVDPNKYLSVDLGEMEAALHDRVIDTSRSIAAGGSPMVLLKDTGTLSKELNKDLRGVRTKDNAGVLSTVFRWGIYGRRLNVKEIVPADNNLLRAFEKSLMETLEARAETIEARNLIDNTKRIAKDLDITNRQAAVLFHRERDKGRHVVVAGEGSDKDNIVEMIVAALQGNKGSE